MQDIPKSLRLYAMYHKDFKVPTGKYYVYTHVNPLTDRVFYVGSAKGNPLRAYEFNKHRGKAWKEEVLSFGGTCNIIVNIIKYYDNPYSAQTAEFELIKSLKSVGEAYCSQEGCYIFQRKYHELQYIVLFNEEEKVFRTKSEMYIYCTSRFDLSKNIINSLIKCGDIYKGSKESAHGLKIIVVGKEHQ